MNSDKLDNFIKEQIDSLDHVEVPGTKWNKQASWDKIAGQNRKRKAGIFWIYFGGLAATLLILIAFWFYGFNWDDSNFLQPIANENKLNSGIPGEIEKAENDQAKAVDESMEEISSTKQKPSTENFAVAEESPPTGKLSKPQLEALPRLIPQKRVAQIKTEIGANEKPILRSSAIEQGLKQPETLAFNRTYIILKESGSEPLDPGPALTLSINMPIKSKTDPPTGSLSRLK